MQNEAYLFVQELTGPEAPPADTAAHRLFDALKAASQNLSSSDTRNWTLAAARTRPQS